MGIPTVQLQLEQLSIPLFRNIATLLEHIPIMFKHKRSKNATLFAMIFKLEKKILIPIHVMNTYIDSN